MEAIAKRNVWLLLIVTAGSQLIAADAPAPPLEKPGWRLTFHDEFDGPKLNDWYLDGKEIHTYEGETPQEKMFILLGLYEGAVPGWVGPTDANMPYPREKWVTNVCSSRYDLSNLGTCQELECTFTAPDNATSGRIALEKRTPQR